MVLCSAVRDNKPTGGDCRFLIGMLRSYQGSGELYQGAKGKTIAACRALANFSFRIDGV